MSERRTVLEELFSLAGKSALVTGASGGIGRALAVGFARAGAVVGCHGRNETDLAETLRQVEAAGGRAIVLRAELETVKMCQKLVADARGAMGRIDVLVNNAGMNRRKPIVEVDEDDFETIVNVNLRSAFFLSQAVYPMMKEQGGGKIINIGSMTSTIGLGNVSVYGVTKSGLAQLTKTMAVEWAKDNIQVNCLAPGFMMTPLTEKGLWGDEKKRQWILERVPARRPGKAEELVGMAILMASEASSFLSGQVISVDGGFLAGGSWDA